MATEAISLCKQKLPPLFAKPFDVLLLEVTVYPLNCHHYRADGGAPVDRDR
jgi:hypothetical protein